MTELGDPSRVAAERAYRLVLKCDPVPEALASAARQYVDEHRLRDPYNSALTLDGRVAPAEWRGPSAEAPSWYLG